MKKAIPILLVVFLCLLVAFSAVCEYRQQHPVPEELRLSFDANSAYRFRNAEGETLEYDDLGFSGDMQIIDSVLGGVDAPPYFYLTLPYSKRLEADFVDGGPDAYVRVSTDLALWGVEGSGVQRAVFTGSGIETTGEKYEPALLMTSIWRRPAAGKAISVVCRGAGSCISLRRTPRLP